MLNLRRREMAMAIVGGAALGPGGDAVSADRDGTSANKAVIASLIEVVWRQGRIDELPRFWTVDCVNHADPAPEKQGLAALKRYHETFAAGFADLEGVKIAIDQQVAETDRVVTQTTMTAVHKPSGRPVSLQSIRIDRLAGGKIAEHWSVADTAGLMRQLA